MPGRRETWSIEDLVLSGIKTGKKFLKDNAAKKAHQR